MGPKLVPELELNDLLDLEEFTVGDTNPDLQLELDLDIQKQESSDIEGNY